MHRMEAVEQFQQAQKTMNRMWHAMRYARLNLLELNGRRWVSRNDREEAVEMIRSTRKLYLEAQEHFFACHRALVLGSTL
jgi:hypothetical protein